MMTEKNRQKLKFIIPLGIGGLFLLTLPLFGGSYYMHIFILIFINMTLVTGYRLLYETGLGSFAHASFYAIGAFTSAWLAISLGLPFGVCFLGAGIFAAIVAVIVGWPAMRLEDIYFFLVSFALFAVVYTILTHWRNVTGGWGGMSGIPPIMGLRGEMPYYYIIMAFTALVLFILYRLDKSQFGAELLAIGDAADLAATVGINVTRHRVIAFAIGALLAGFAGSLYAHYANYISPTGFSFWFTVYILIWCVIGGYRKFWGPVVGAALMTFIAEMLRAAGTLQIIIYGAVLIIVIMLMPYGIAGLVDSLRERRARLRLLGHEIK
jgi:branched-chain amino acid transport system permease protein